MICSLLLLSGVSGLAIAPRPFRMDTDALWRVLAPFAADDMEPGKEGVTLEQVKAALSAKDTYGQALTLPPMLVLENQVDANKDGFVSKEEMKKWAGFEGHIHCNRVGERSFGCADRCIGGVDDFNGNSSFFSYGISKSSYDLEEFNDKPKPYAGGIVRTHRAVIKKAIETVLAQKIPGNVVELGIKDRHIWRLMADTLKAGNSDKKLELYDSFEGFEACDHSIDIGMCPSPGEPVYDVQGIEKYVSEFADASKVTVHKEKYDSMKLNDPISLALVDGALYPTVGKMLAALKAKMAPGGIILVHDFGWEGFPGVEKATTEFVSENKDYKLSLPGTADGVACYMGQLEKQASQGGTGFFR